VSRNFVCILSEVPYGEKQDFGLPAIRSTLSVREFLAAVRLAGLSSSFIGRQTSSQAGADRESSDSISGTPRLLLGSRTIEISFGLGGFDLPRKSIIAYVPMCQ